MHHLPLVASAISGYFVHQNDQIEVDTISFDTRRIIHGQSTLFLALKGIDRDGHDFISSAYSKGVRNFMVSEDHEPEFLDANYIQVPDVLSALWNWAFDHRTKLTETIIIGITGSNGKTIVKEWLYQMLSTKYKVGKSPRSYNSRLGVPLSLLEISLGDEIGIIEVGISEKGEMAGLARMVRPDIGIITNIGDAHSQGFSSKMEKLTEKLQLFKRAKKVIFQGDDLMIHQTLLQLYPQKPYVSWGEGDENTLKLLSLTPTEILFTWNSENKNIHFSKPIPYVENLLHCLTVSLEMGVEFEKIKSRIFLFDQLEMRLEHIQALNNSIIINDAYILDKSSLKLSLDHLMQSLEDRSPALILSDFPIGLSQKEWKELEIMIRRYPLTRIITVGIESAHLETFAPERYHFETTRALFESIQDLQWENHAILLKGSRKYGLDQLVRKLERQSHSAILEINLSALSHNINIFKNKLQPGTGLIPVIKASAYGGGIEKIAQTIANHDPAFIAVAFIDEGVELRLAGINSRIIVLNPDPEKIKLAFNFELELEVYSFEILDKIIHHHTREKIPPIHLKIDTGMHRMGFLKQDIPKLLDVLLAYPDLAIATIFSHLSGSEDEKLDAYSKQQISTFLQIHQKIVQSLDRQIPRHILNSEGIIRFPESHFEYVRLGLGLYGISSSIKFQLQKVHCLYARIIHIKCIKSGQSVGYSRAEYANRDTVLGIVNIGYADGYMRSLSQGKGKVYYSGKLVPIIGNICMDVTIIDLTNVENPRVGDRVELFGNNLPIEKVAQEAGTIPYEILTRLSSRIVRKHAVDY